MAADLPRRDGTIAHDDDEDEVVSCMVTYEIKCIHTVCDACLCDEIPLNIYNSLRITL